MIFRITVETFKQKIEVVTGFYCGDSPNQIKNMLAKNANSGSFLGIDTADTDMIVINTQDIMTIVVSEAPAGSTEHVHITDKV